MVSSVPFLSLTVKKMDKGAISINSAVTATLVASQSFNFRLNIFFNLSPNLPSTFLCLLAKLVSLWLGWVPPNLLAKMERF
jgi:hypothetical protein